MSTKTDQILMILQETVLQVLHVLLFHLLQKNGTPAQTRNRPNHSIHDQLSCGIIMFIQSLAAIVGKSQRWIMTQVT